MAVETRRAGPRTRRQAPGPPRMHSNGLPFQNLLCRAAFEGRRRHHGHVHTGTCPYRGMSIQGHVHTGACPYRGMSIQGHVRTGTCPCGRCRVPPSRLNRAYTERPRCSRWPVLGCRSTGARTKHPLFRRGAEPDQSSSLVPPWRPKYFLPRIVLVPSPIPLRQTDGLKRPRPSGANDTLDRRRQPESARGEYPYHPGGQVRPGSVSVRLAESSR